MAMKACEFCGKELKPGGYKGHIRLKHPDKFQESQQKEDVILEDSSKLKTEILTLSDSIEKKDSEINLLSESVKTQEVEFAILHDEISQLSSLEHEQDIVRNTLKNLTKDAYELIGQQLGFVSLENSAELGDKETISTIHESLVNGQRRQMVSQIKKYGLYDFWQAYKDYLYSAGIDDAQAYQYFSDAVISYFRFSTQGKMKDSAPAADPGAPPAGLISTDDQAKTSKLEDHEPDPAEYIFIGDKKQSGWKFYPEMGFSLKLS